MRKTTLAAVVALTVSAFFAQTEATAQNAGNAGPANLCQELVAFMKASPPKPAPTSQATEREQNSGSAQDASGQSGPAHAAPEPNSTRATESGTEDAPQKSGLSAPVPADPEGTSKNSVITVAEAERLARANDIPACREAGRGLRLAGVVMPSPLLALLALDLQYQQKTAPQ